MARNMQIRIIFDSISLDNRFLTGWGASYLIDEKILFDTGEETSSLFKNMETMGVKIPDIKAVVISHDHWDHTGGLWGILKENHKLKIYVCPHFSRGFKERIKSYDSKLIEMDKFTQISEDIYTTGETGGRYAFKYMPEQSLVIKTHNGLTILTGCAHPGIIKIIENVKKNISGKIYLVLGGFHLLDKPKKTIESVLADFRKLEIRKVAPLHCTGRYATEIFKEEYKDDFVSLKAGEIIEV